MSLFRRTSKLVRAYFGIEELKRKTDALVDQPRELISTTFDYCGSAFKAIQVEEELENLIKDVRKLNPQRILEIGTAQGGTFFIWARLARPDATIVSIDLPRGRFGGGYNLVRAWIYRRFAGKGQRIHLLRVNSHHTTTLQTTRKLFRDQQIDFLFLDGDHTFEGVSADWEMYSPLVRSGGIIAFHDIGSNYEDTQVRRFWDSVKLSSEFSEYAVDPAGLCGIGVLVKG